jgi:hypothetical protein
LTGVTLKAFSPVDSLFPNPTSTSFTIKLVNSIGGCASEYRVSRFADFRDANWMPYSASPKHDRRANVVPHHDERIDADHAVLSGSPKESSRRPSHLDQRRHAAHVLFQRRPGSPDSFDLLRLSCSLFREQAKPKGLPSSSKEGLFSVL